LGFGDWEWGIGDWAQSPIPNPQSPIPNPQNSILNKNKISCIYFYLKKNYFLNKIKKIKWNKKLHFQVFTMVQ